HPLPPSLTLSAHSLTPIPPTQSERHAHSAHKSQTQMHTFSQQRQTQTHRPSAYRRRTPPHTHTHADQLLQTCAFSTPHTHTQSLKKGRLFTFKQFPCEMQWTNNNVS